MRHIPCKLLLALAILLFTLPAFVSDKGITRQQLEGATLYGLTATLKGEINMQNGQIVQSNFDDYPVLKSRTLRNLTYICWRTMKLREDLAKPEPR